MYAEGNSRSDCARMMFFFSSASFNLNFISLCTRVINISQCSLQGRTRYAFNFSSCISLCAAMIFIPTAFIGIEMLVLCYRNVSRSETDPTFMRKWLSVTVNFSIANQIWHWKQNLEWKRKRRHWNVCVWKRYYATETNIWHVLMFSSDFFLHVFHVSTTA